jgi:hypothetical protein
VYWGRRDPNGAHELVIKVVPAGEDGHLQRVERQAGAQVVSHLPADDLPGEQVSHERRIHEPAGRGHIRDIGDPAAIRRWRGEVPFQQVSRPGVRAAGTVVRGFFCPAETPAIPSSRISRSTVHRATSIPSRRSCCHTFRAPYSRRPFFRKLQDRAGRFDTEPVTM